MAATTIEWADSTWNPLTGCTKVSPGCQNCYAERMTKRLKAMGQPNYVRGFRLVTHPHVPSLPEQWRKPQNIFVNSMSDLFHDRVPEGFIRRVFDVMGRASWHRFQILTKRSARLARLAGDLPWHSNVWMGVSVETEEYLYRVEHLRRTGALIKFLSLEPLLGPLTHLELTGIDWVVVGGESGPGARPMREEWVADIRDRCVAAGVPFFFKQWGGVRKKRTGRILQKRTGDQVPGSKGFEHR
jgi:protein gp37